MKKEKKRWTAQKKTVVFSILGILLLALIAAGVYINNILNNPEMFFTNEPMQQPAATATANAGSDSEPQPTPTPGIQTEDNIVNILLIGIDYNEKRTTEKYSYKDFHSDTMMVAALNFTKNTINLISLPRDTYTEIPGVKGIYKLNGSINCGGGFEAADGAGFKKVCESASALLGGIPVNYYYAATMPAVTELVDSIGGVDFDLDFDFIDVDNPDEPYKKGMQHMDGKDVLAYLRVRKNVKQHGDLNRINRQKRMMVTIFNKMKSEGLLTSIPAMLSAFDGQLYTNCTTEQTAAFAAFALRCNAEDIGMYSIDGKIEGIFNWSFCITDQENRVEVIKEVYGVDVPKKMQYSESYAYYYWDTMKADQALRTCIDLEYAVTEQLETADDNQKRRYDAYIEARTALEDTMAEADLAGQQYLVELIDSMDSYSERILSKLSSFRSAATKLASAFSYSEELLVWDVHYESDPNFNEVYVDFR